MCPGLSLARLAGRAITIAFLSTIVINLERSKVFFLLAQFQGVLSSCFNKVMSILLIQRFKMENLGKGFMLVEMFGPGNLVPRGPSSDQEKPK